MVERDEDSLVAFLNDIGLQSVPCSAHTGPPRIAAYLERINAQVASHQEELHRLLSSNLPQFSRACESALSFTLRLSSIASHVEYNEKEIERVKQRISNIVSTHAALTARLSKYTALHHAISAISHLRERLNNLSSLVRDSKIQQAIQVLPGLDRDPEQAIEWIKDATQWKELQARKKDLVGSLKDRIQSALIECVHCEADSLRVLSASKDGRVALGDLMMALQYFHIQESFLQITCDRLFEHVIYPYLTVNSSLVLENEEIKHTRQVEEARLATLSTLTEYLTNRIPELLNLVRFPLLQAIISDLLIPSLRPTTDLQDLANFQNILTNALSFEQSLVDPPNTEDGPIHSWSKQTSFDWIKKMNERYAGEIRNIVLQLTSSKGWESVPIDWRADYLPQALFHEEKEQVQPIVKSVSNNSVNDDVWDISNDTSASGSIVDEVEDAWGLEEPNVDEEGWGLDQDIDLSPVQSLNGNTEESGWEIEDHENGQSQEDLWGSEWAVEEATTSADLPKSKSKRKLGAVPISQLPLKTPPKVSRKSKVLSNAGVEDALAPRMPEAIAEKISISSHVEEVWKLALQIIEDIQTVACHRDFDYLQPTNQLVSRLQRTFLDIFDYYRATMLVQHSKLIHQVPALGMQFSNDLEYLAWRLSANFKEDESKWEGQRREDASFTYQALRTAAILQRQKQLTAQNESTRELIESIHLDGLSSPQAFAEAERSAKQIVHMLIRLSHVWKPIMSSSAFYENMGRIVNDILKYQMTMIEEMTDIGEQDSKRINVVCKHFNGLEDCFQGETSVGLHVPLWFKFAYLLEILDASMIDIMFLVDSGSLVDFRAEELVNLVRALFSESPTRQQNIAKIRQALQ